jgi:glutaredoxin
MLIYISSACSMVSKTLATLEKLQLDFTTVDIDADVNAREELKRLAKGNLSVPTLVISEREVLIEPTPEQLMARFGGVGSTAPQQIKRTANQRSLDAVSNWLKMALVLAFGLLAFVLGYQVLPNYVSISPTVLSGGSIGLLIFMLLAGKRMKLGKLTTSPRAKLVFLVAYSAIMGLGLASGGRSTGVNLWLVILLLGGSIMLVIRIGKHLRFMYRKLRNAQRILGVITVGGFSLLLGVGLAAPRSFAPDLALPLVVSSGMLLLATCLQVSQLEKPRVDQMQSVVFSSLALLVAVSLIFSGS